MTRFTVFKCDECKKEFAKEPPISLKGVSDSRGDIPLPEQYMEKTFCSKKCLLDFVNGII